MEEEDISCPVFPRSSVDVILFFPFLSCLKEQLSCSLTYMCHLPVHIWVPKRVHLILDNLTALMSSEK